MGEANFVPGTWQPGDDPGQRQFVELKGSNTQASPFEGGGSLPSVTVAFETWADWINNARTQFCVTRAVR